MIHCGWTIIDISGDAVDLFYNKSEAIKEAEELDEVFPEDSPHVVVEAFRKKEESND